VRTVVVGGQGFLGGAIVEELLARNDSVVVVDRRASQDASDLRFGAAAVTARTADILDPASLRAAFDGADEVYHFAGRLGTSELNDDIAGAIDVNVRGTVNVFDAALRTDVPVVFHPSKPNVWLNAYTITKVACEQFGLLYCERGLRVCSLRYFNAYGPYQPMAPVRKIIPTFAIQAIRREPITVFGDGNQTVDMIYAPDAARISVDFVRSGGQGEPMDLGRGIPLTVNEVADQVNAFFGSSAGIRHVAMRPGETPGTKLVANLAPLRGVLGNVRFADWSASLATTLAWYGRNAPPTIRPPRNSGRTVSAVLGS
jgi:UDP-glucose 4-epimerase